MSDIKYYIGPMSKNIVDSVIELNNPIIGFIPSRRQVDYKGGYVNNWTTKQFSEYVNNKVVIERDHGGKNQGYKRDNGLSSFVFDANYFDIIHIDPWKAYQDFDKGLQDTIECINFIYYEVNNRKVKFEVGTEESIRRFEVDELEKLLSMLEKKLNPNVFENIIYTVVQSGVGLDLGNSKNTCKFSEKRFYDMIKICDKFGKMSKEHNGDYLSVDEYKLRFDLGMDAINIAPQFGQLETLCYLDEMGDDIEDYYRLCYESKRWVKWVNDDFDPENNKRELIEICGHYILSDKRFLKIKPNIDVEIKQKIKNKLRSLHNDNG